MDGIRIVLGDEYMRLSYEEAYDLKIQLDDIFQNEIAFGTGTLPDDIPRFIPSDPQPDIFMNTTCGGIK